MVETLKITEKNVKYLMVGENILSEKRIEEDYYVKMQDFGPFLSSEGDCLGA
ncbi:MAG: hypothetical protein K1060chlam4_00266 [Candidatus Anoxychlamydiales bacterium]|nr:hypothetical protein [Candidatus Anoxychlamydiales bacterium]